MKSQALKGHLDLLLLAVLADGPRHGYGVIEELRVRSGDAFDLPEGTVYPALHRLEEAKLVTSAWSDVGGRRRRTYAITKRGVRALGEQTRTWDEFAAAVSRVIRGGAQWQPT